MPVFNQSRGASFRSFLRWFFGDRGTTDQPADYFCQKYKLAAENNAVFRKVIYPDRGIIFDRKRKAILENINSYDLMVTPSETRGMDTFALRPAEYRYCRI
jgi:penicillin-binding protein 2